MSVASAGCVLWLARFQPLFATIAIGSLAYQVWLVWRRPRQRRTRMMRIILWSTSAATIAAGAIQLALWVRYW